MSYIADLTMSEIYTTTIHNNRSIVIRSTPIQYIELVLETQCRPQHGTGSYPVQTSGASYEQHDTEGVVSEYPSKSHSLIRILNT